MQQHGNKYLSRTPASTLGWSQKVKIQLFKSIVMLHIKIKGMTHAAT